MLSANSLREAPAFPPEPSVRLGGHRPGSHRFSLLPGSQGRSFCPQCTLRISEFANSGLGYGMEYLVPANGCSGVQLGLAFLEEPAHGIVAFESNGNFVFLMCFLARICSHQQFGTSRPIRLILPEPCVVAKFFQYV